MRLTFTDKDNDDIIEVSSNPATNEILQENHYYPFGMNMNGQWIANPGRDDKYQYNGMEKNDDFDFNSYTTSYRIYDPIIGRWLQVDPKYSYSVSPFIGMGNNPIILTDPLGDTTHIFFRREEGILILFIVIPN
ncbi:MAG: hypothetical protein IPJ74_08515 [Saprospiraceae bacterium]|nr:hypothetical protein [Saprospiraceae bacterium]